MTALIVNAHNPVDATAGPVSKPLPTGAPAGSEVSVEKYDLTANTVTVTGSIRGVAAQSIVLSLGREALSFRADSAGSWWPVSGHKTLASLTALFDATGAAVTAQSAAIAAAATDAAARYIGRLEQILRLAPVDPLSVYVLSTLVPTVTLSAASATTSIVGGVQFRPKRAAVGGSTAVDLTGDEAIQYRGTPSLTYGTVNPDNNYARVSLLTGGSSQAAYWYCDASTIYDGQVLEVAFKAITTATKYRLWIDGRRVTERMQSVTTVAGSTYLLKIDLLTAATRHIRVEWKDQPFGGFWIEPTATLIKAAKPLMTLCVLGDSIPGGANVERGDCWPSRTADLLGCDEIVNVAIGGTGYLVGVGVSDYRTRIADAVAKNPDIMIVIGGQNDYGGSVTAANAGAEAQYVIGQLHTQLPRALIVLVGMWSPGSPNQTRIDFNNAFRTAAAAVAGTIFVDLLDPRGNGQTAPVWAQGTFYREGDVVLNGVGGPPYVSVVGHTATSTFDSYKLRATAIFSGTGTAGTSRTVTDGVLNSTTTLTSATAVFVTGDVGRVVTGTGIPVNTRILTRTNATTVVLSQAATATATGVTVVLTNGRMDGNADIGIQSDGTHPTQSGCLVLERYIPAEILRQIRLKLASLLGA